MFSSSVETVAIGDISQSLSLKIRSELIDYLHLINFELYHQYEHISTERSISSKKRRTIQVSEEKKSSKWRDVRIWDTSHCCEGKVNLKEVYVPLRIKLKLREICSIENVVVCLTHKLEKIRFRWKSRENHRNCNRSAGGMCKTRLILLLNASNGRRWEVLVRAWLVNSPWEFNFYKQGKNSF